MKPAFLVTSFALFTATGCFFDEKPANTAPPPAPSGAAPAPQPGEPPAAQPAAPPPPRSAPVPLEPPHKVAPAK